MPVNYILFSPIGKHDPVPSNLRDGPMLHICRKMSPSKLYLYYSSEICAYKEKDDRYVKAVEDLCRRTDKNIEIKEIFDRDMTEVHKFNLFIPLFGCILRDIHKENPDSTLLVNITSGTSAMMTALLMLSLTLPFELIAVQVDSPEKKTNGPERPEDYDGDVYLPLNEDYDENAPDRCHIEKYPNMKAEIIRESICSHIKHYDYEAAVREAEEIKEFLSPYSLSLLCGAVERTKMNLAPFKKALREQDKAVITELQGDRMGIFEYMLWLHMKYDRGDLSDFIRGITPALYKLSEKYLGDIGADLSPYLKMGKGNEKLLKRELLSSDSCGKEYLRILDEKFFGCYKDGPLSSEICITLITALSDKASLCEKFTSLREFEQKIRNQIAHDIVKTDEAKIEAICGMNVKQIWAVLRDVSNAVLNVGGESWHAYERMNDLLTREIKATKST